MTVSREVLDDLATYVGFDGAVAGTLRELGPFLEPAFPKTVDAFYSAIERSPSAKGVFSGPEQVERLKRTLLVWLRELFGGDYGDAYFEARARIGRTHVRVGLEQRYMVSAMNVVRASLATAVLDSEWPVERRLEATRAIHMVCDLDLGVMLETYREDYVHRRTFESETLAAMGRLTAGLAHEIRNPLNAAKLQLDVLERSTQKADPGDMRERVGRRVTLVKSELGRLSALLDDFLNLARPRWISAEPFDMGELLREFVEFQTPALESRGISVSVSLDPAVGVVSGERDRLKQVMTNLVMNAAEALDGRPSAAISIQSALLSDGPAERVEVVGRSSVRRDQQSVGAPLGWTGRTRG
ncbi:MAG: hypothetical protein KC417_02715, partial [Myxococcales bacterium]|nr:hypothetical protein [Myxococcales bacterium]